MAFNYWQKFDEDEIYHIYNRSIQDTLLFLDESDYHFFLEKYKLYLAPYFQTFAYCLIPNHFHLLVKIKTLDEFTHSLLKQNTVIAKRLIKNEADVNDFISDQERRFFSSVALRFNKKYRRRGPLFSEKFKRIKINSDSNFLQMICYVHHNPIHHHLVKSMSDWKYSSYASYFSQSETSLRKDVILKWFGGLEYFEASHISFRQENKLLSKIT